MRVRFLAMALLASFAGFCSAAFCPAFAAGAQTPRIIFYADRDYRGDQRSANGDVRDFRSLGFNDTASSVRVVSGVWQLCTDADFRGRCLTLRADDRNLVPEGFNDRISSVRQLPDDRFGTDAPRAGGAFAPRDGGGVTLFSDIDFRGERRVLAGAMDDFARIGFNDVVSSIRIRGGSWQFCENASLSGRCMTFSSDVRSLVDYGFNDRISSARRVR